MKQFNVGPGKVLISKYKGIISAVSSKCTHIAFPLHTGAFKNGKIRCPHHGACFDATTGDIEDFPGLDSLQKYEVHIRNGNVFVVADEESLVQHKRVKTMETCCSTEEIFLIIGGGYAALVCAETLRQNCFKGQIIMVTNEDHVPYDRTILSKFMNIQTTKIYLRSKEFLEKHNIIIQYGKTAESVDTKEHCVKFSDGTSQNYTKLFVATGGKPKKLTVPGHDLNGVYYLRSPEDAKELYKAFPGKRIVIIGTSFIGLESASCFMKKAKSVAVIGSGQSKVPFEKLLGHKLGSRILKLHLDKGVKFHLSHPVNKIQGSMGKVSKVVLEDGTVISADLVLIGIGLTPSSEFLRSTNVKLDEVGNVIVDEFMCATGDVYAGGDVASFPYFYGDNQLVNLGHWQLAGVHGRIAALNMMGKQTPCKTVPFFWTRQFGCTLRYVGHCASFDEIIYKGDVEKLKFAAYYHSSGKLVAAATVNMLSITSEIAFQIENNSCPAATQIRLQ